MEMTTIHQLTTDYFVDPIGIGKKPSFSWIIQSDARNVKQTAFRFQLAGDSSFESLLWDSGVVQSDRSAHYCPSLLPLASATRYYWRVHVQLGGGKAFDCSETASFVTALLEVDEWCAHFISAETQADAANSKGTYVQNRFLIEGEIETAYAYATALGLYQLYINDEKAGDDQLTPGWTSYHKHLMVQAYDVAGLLRQGENGICGHLGAGWYKGLMGFLHSRNNYGKQTALLCQIEITYKDGRHQTIATDDSWQGADSPVLFSEIYDGEIYDARKVLANWRPVQRLSYDFATLETQPGCRVKIMEMLPIKQILTTPKGECVLDVGQNMTGWVRFTVSGKAGDVVELRCFETLDTAGNVYTDNLRAAKQTIHYTLAGDAVETYQPTFTFQGFRYVHVITYPGRVKPEAFVACVVHSDLQQIGTFDCSDPLLNQLQRNIQWSLKGNFVDIPTDCPQRDERMGWTGDAQIFCPTACYLTGAYPFFRKWMKDVALDQTPEGGVAHVVPDILTGDPKLHENWLLAQGTHSAAAWSDVALIVPWNLYLAYGDTQILKAQYHSMQSWIDYMQRHAQGCIWQDQLQFGDWVALDAAEGSYYGATPNEFVCAAYYALSTSIFAKVAQVLHKEEDAQRYQALYEQIVAHFAQTFFSSAGELLVKTQTAHVLALHFGLTPPQYAQKTVQALIALIQNEKGHLVTGFVGTPYITHALSGNGHLKEAYDLLLKQDYPSWLYQVKIGATTIWEHWDGIKPDGTMWSPDMNSFNHYAYGAIGNWLYRTIGGLQLDEEDPGYHHTVIHPQIGGGITYAQVSNQTVYGKVAVHWSLQDVVTLTVQVPCNTTATILLDEAEVLDADGLRFVAKPNQLSADAGSGHYTIRYRIKKA